MDRLGCPAQGRPAVFVACSTLSFARYPLEQALRAIAELGFGKVDVAIHDCGPHLRPSVVVEDVHRAAQELRIGPGLAPAAFSVMIESADQAEFQRQLKAVCRLASLSMFPSCPCRRRRSAAASTPRWIA